MKLPITLALDIGTSSVRAALYDGSAKALPRSSVKIERTLTRTLDGGSEIDADEAFAQVVAAIDAALAKADRLNAEIEFVAMCSFWHSLMGVDATGKPTTKVLSWADTRSREYTEVLRKRFNERETHNRTGARFHSSFWPAKLLWLKKESPDVFARTIRWMSLSDYVSLKLFGDAATSVSMASGTGIFDQRKCDWDSELTRYLGVKRTGLPMIAGDDATFSLVTKFAKRWPRLKNACWFPAVADGAADNIGSGCVTKNRAALMVGTSGAMRIAYTGEPPKRVPDGLWCYRLDRTRVIIGGALSDGGGLYHWLKKNLKISRNTTDEMRRRGAAAHGLVFMPFLAGERSTGYHESAAGAILGLTASHDAIDILQAGMESVAYRFAEIFGQLARMIEIDEIVASGGALRESPVWTQIIADVLGRDLTISGTRESSMRGAVLLALESIGKIESIDNLPTPKASTLAYHPECHAAYRIARTEHRQHYDRTFK
ncbi:MAG: gluconokinase [Pyrinomonadaceae bacterium]